MIRVLLVDDQELVRTGLRGILRAPFGFEVVGECADGGEVIAAVEATGPDVVLMDVRMPFTDGVQATIQLRRREGSPPVLALTTFDDDQALAGMLRAGASGFVLKGVPAEDLQRAVRMVAQPQLGEQVVDVRLDRALADEQLGGDLAVGLAQADEREHLEFAASQRG